MATNEIPWPQSKEFLAKLRRGERPGTSSPPGNHKASRSKYGNIPSVIRDSRLGELRFDSRREAEAWQMLAALRDAGEIRILLRQVRVDLPGGVIYRADFLAWWKDGRLEILDAKGRRTEAYSIKRRQVRSVHGIEITEV